MLRIVLSALMMLSACAQIPYIGDHINASLADVRVASMGALEQSYGLRLRLQNPTAKRYEFKGLSYEVELNGRRFARGVSPQAVTLEPYGEALLDVTAVSDTPALLNQILRLKSGKSKIFRYRLLGSLHTSQLARSYLSFDQVGEFDFSALAPATEGLDEAEGR